jgi:hypothetical protein
VIREDNGAEPEGCADDDDEGDGIEGMGNADDAVDDDNGNEDTSKEDDDNGDGCCCGGFWISGCCCCDSNEVSSGGWCNTVSGRDNDDRSGWSVAVGGADGCDIGWTALLTLFVLAVTENEADAIAVNDNGRGIALIVVVVFLMSWGRIVVVLLLLLPHGSTWSGWYRVVVVVPIVDILLLWPNLVGEDAAIVEGDRIGLLLLFLFLWVWWFWKK